MNRRNLLAFVCPVIFFIVVVYVALPVLALDFVGFWVLLLFVFLITFGIAQSRMVKKIAAVLAGICLLIMIFYTLFGSSVLMNTAQYRNLLGNVDTGKFNADMEPISLSEIRIIDEESAEKIGDKLLGSDPAIGSRVVHGDYTLQRVRNHLYWVSPLLHSGFWKWKNNEGTPGYVIVSATDAEDARLVEQVDNKDLLIRYQPEAYFSDDLERHIRFNGYAGVGLTDFAFEVDDSLHPFWVVTAYVHAIGFGGSVTKEVLVVNPATGEITPYTPDKAPIWIDRIQPSDFVKDQIDDWGEYINGYWNWSDRGKLTVTDDELSLVYGSDGRCYFYTGITSVGKDNGTIGFMLVDSRSKKAKLYKQPGAVESSAKTSAEGKVQQMGYRASYPVMYNIAGIPTYVMALKDKGGLVKEIAMVSVADYSIVGSGADVQEALNDYQSNLVSKGNQLVPNGQNQPNKIKATVLRINAGTIGGNTQYYLVLNNYANKIFIGRASLSEKLPVTQPGDLVEVSFSDSKSETVNLSGFDNLQLALQKAPVQLLKDAYADSVRIDSDGIDAANAKWEQLSVKEKIELLKRVKR